MTVAQNMQAERQKLDRWQANSHRVTFFLSEKPSSINVGLWNLLTGDDPETSTNQPRLASFSEEGPFGAHRLVIRVGPGRIDLILGPQSSDDASATIAGSISEPPAGFDAVVGRLVEIVSKNVTRVAFGLVVHLPTSGREEGYRQLAPYLTAVKIDPEKSRDFLYQINRRRTVLIANTQYIINRLSKWGVSAFVRAQISQVDKMSVPGISISSSWDPVHVCRIDLDINSVPDVDAAIAPTHVAELLRVLMQQALEIVSEGDIP